MESMEALNKSALRFLAASSQLYPALDALTTELHEIENTVGNSGFRREVLVPLANGKHVAYCKNGGGWGVRILAPSRDPLNWEEASADDKAAIGIALEEFVRAITKAISECAMEREHAAATINLTLQVTRSL